MSMFKSYFRGWQFRTTRPNLAVGDEVNVFINHYDETERVGIANIGDSRLYVEGAEPEHLDQRVAVEVTEFDETDSRGRGRFQGVVGESSYTA